MAKKNSEKEDKGLKDLEEEIKLIQEKLKDYDYKQESKIAYENLMYESGQRFCKVGQVWDKATGACVEKTQNAPRVFAGPDITVYKGTQVTLSGTATDVDNNIKVMSWAQSRGKLVTLSPSADGSTAKFTADSEGLYTFDFSAVDTTGLSGSDAINVVCLPQPSTGTFKVNAGTDRTIKSPTFPTVVQLAGKITGKVSIKTFGWTGLPSIPKTLAPQVIIPAEGVYEITLSATSVKGDQESDTVKITATKDTTEPPKCPPGEKYDPILQKCVPDVIQPCPPGQHRDPNGNCVPDVPPVGDVDAFGMKMLFKTTGKKVAMEKGTNHENGQRYNVNHTFQNYIMQGYFKLGKGQEKINMKGDGPNHGGCTTIKNFECLWYELDIALADGKFLLQYEMPHPDNHDVADNKCEVVRSVGKLNEGQWVGWAVAYFFDDKGFRNMQAFVDKNPFDAQNKPLNNWELGLHAIEKGQIVSGIKLPRRIPVDFDEGLEAEIRMHRATNSDTDMKNVFVFEINPQGGTQPPPPPPPTDEPVAKLSAPSQVQGGSDVTLDGSQSVADTLEIKQTAGQQVNLTDSGTFKKKFTAPNGNFSLGFEGKAIKGTKQAITQVAIQVSTNLPPPPPPPTGEVLWDSNVHLKTGQKYTITDTYGSQAPNGKGVFMAASGSPRIHVDADGTFHLEADGGHGRVYIKATNFNARWEGECMFEDANIRNTTWRLRSRHNAGGSCENRFGGFGATCEREEQLAEYATEPCHNIHENVVKKPLAKNLEIGKWFKFKYTVQNSPDNKEVLFKTEYDYNDGKGFVTVLEGKHPSPKPYYMDEAKFKEESYAWLRVNNEKTGSIAYKNVRIVKI